MERGTPMTKQFIKELDQIKQRILTLGAQVENRVQRAIQAVGEVDVEIAQEIIHLDYEIDEMEVEIEEECLKVLALHQPVAIDLRFIIAVIKINQELERIGDQAVNIAQRVEIVGKRPRPAFTFDYSVMGEKALRMLKLSLDALVQLDADLAYKVITLDDDVDRIKNEAYDRIKQAIQDMPERVGYFINLLLISRHLERLADHATNIAEEVIYLVEGEIFRHAPY
jgi:phosphate transport system protein